MSKKQNILWNTMENGPGNVKEFCEIFLFIYFIILL